MKAEINNENKAKFFALYYDQVALFTCSFVKGEDLKNVLNGNDELEYGQKAYLTLKPLSQISDEDAIGFAKILDPFQKQGRWDLILEHKDQVLNIIDPNADLATGDFTVFQFIHLTDFLRSKGYSLPWMGLSVDEMVDAGWIKLTAQ